ncbi:hypothetical protein KP509_39G004800 [Ceratopteris richardii]|uniref:Chromo domain-containing protein n=1 Tax=Ceratopteris richardii TaxID=49495 RepID=A0A8T2PY65_CERRI|nr:hypothetical protein KP509_39G004800 [Ceratopteris richardii]
MKQEKSSEPAYDSLCSGFAREVFVYLGTWKIVKKLGEVAYRLDLPLDCKFHPVFHVSREDSLIEGIVSLQESKSTDHSPDRILNQRQKRFRNSVVSEYFVTWRGLPLSGSIWESEALVRKYFPSLIIEDNDL